MDIKNKIKSLLSPSSIKMQTHINDEGNFVLKFKNLEIGYLRLKENYWEFSYSDAFKKQNKIQTIADFPNKNKLYKQDTLWPFFASRIPSTATPYVQRKVDKNKIDVNNHKDMLIYFGWRSINNPFVLEHKAVIEKHIKKLIT